MYKCSNNLRSIVYLSADLSLGCPSLKSSHFPGCHCLQGHHPYAPLKYPSDQALSPSQRLNKHPLHARWVLPWRAPQSMWDPCKVVQAIHIVNSGIVFAPAELCSQP